MNGVAFSPDGHQLAGADANGAVTLWNTEASWPASPGTNWTVLIASVVAIAVAAAAVALTTREILRARSSGRK